MWSRGLGTVMGTGALAMGLGSGAESAGDAGGGAITRGGRCGGEIHCGWRPGGFEGNGDGDGGGRGRVATRGDGDRWMRRTNGMPASGRNDAAYGGVGTETGREGEGCAG